MPIHERLTVSAPPVLKTPSEALPVLLIARPVTEEVAWKPRSVEPVLELSPTQGSVPGAEPQPSMAICLPAPALMPPVVWIVVLAGRLNETSNGPLPPWLSASVTAARSVHWLP